MIFFGVKPVAPISWLIAALIMLPAAVSAQGIVLTDQEKGLVEHGEVIVREIGITGRVGKEIEVVGSVNAPRSGIVRVLTDYEKYPEFMPHVSRVRVIERKGDRTVLDYTLTLPLGTIKKYRLMISLAESGRRTMVGWRLLERQDLKPEETIKDTTGYWLITEKAPDRSLVLYHVYTDPGPVPFGLGWIVDELGKKSVPETFLQTKLHAERIFHSKSPEQR